MFDTAPADRAVERTRRISEALDECESAVEFRVDVALDVLVFAGCMPTGFDGSKERTELCKRAARAATAVLLGAANVPGEVNLLYSAEQ